MADQVMNFARGKIGYYCGLPAANDAVILVILEATESDDTLNNYDELDALIAAAGNTEATTTNYTRKSLTAGVTYAVNDTSNTAKVTIADTTWTAMVRATTEVWAKLLVCYDGDTTGGTDANIVVLSHHGFVVTPNGGDIAANFDDTNGFWASA